MASIFSRGVILASKRLQEMRENLSNVISPMEHKNDLQTLDKKYPKLIPESTADLNEARKLIYQAIERLNFPENFSDSGK